MSSAVSLPNHIFTVKALSFKRLTSIVHILSPETDNCPYWISGRKRMTIENISWSISRKNVADPAGVEPAASWSPVGRASNWATDITKTCLYNSDPLKPHFYIVKLGFTGVYIIFLISAQKHRLWYSLEPPRRGGSNEYPQSMFWAEMWKITEFFYLKTFRFWW